MSNEGLARRKDPAVHDVRRFRSIVAVDELFAARLVKQLDLAKIEVERVDPFQDDSRQDLSNTFLTEAKIVRSDDWRVDQEETNRVCTVFRHDLHGVGVVLQLL